MFVHARARALYIYKRLYILLNVYIYINVHTIQVLWLQQVEVLELSKKAVGVVPTLTGLQSIKPVSEREGTY